MTGPSSKQGGSIAWMAGNTVAANLLMLLLLVGGLFMARKIQQEVFPEVELDTVIVTVPLPGASPEEVEEGAVLAIEDEVRGLDGVKEVTSESREGSGVVTIELLEDADSQKLVQDIQNAVNRIRTLPEDAENLNVYLAINSRQVLTLMISADTDRHSLLSIAEDVRDALTAKDAITKVEFDNVPGYEIAVEVPMAVLEKYNLTLPQIAAMIRSQSLERSGGILKAYGGEILLRVQEKRAWAREFSKIPVKTLQDGSQILLGDIATVRESFEDEDTFEYFNDLPAVELEVFRIGDQSPISVSDATHEAIEELKGVLSEGVKINVRYDRSDIYRQRIDLLLRNGYLGLGLVFFLLALFLEIRLAFWVTMGIPISFMGSFLFLPSADVTLNMVSLFAFIVALGIVVDDAIVVGENIYEWRSKGLSRLESAIRGTKEVAMPVCFAILTNMVAFTPLFFVPGIMGKFFWMIPAVICTVFLVSLIESLWVLPAHLSHAKKEKENFVFLFISKYQKAFTKKFEYFLSHIYRPFLDASLRRPWLTLATGLAILLVAIGYVKGKHIGFESFPRIESDMCNARVSLQVGSPVEELRKVMEQMVRAAKKVVAENGEEQLSDGIYARIRDNDIRVSVYLKEAGIRPISTSDFRDKWQKAVGEIPGAQSTSFSSSFGGPGRGSDLSVELSHRNTGLLKKAAEDLAKRLEDYSAAKDIDDGYEEGKEQFDIQLKPSARALGISSADAASQMRAAFYGTEAIRQMRGRNEIQVNVRLPETERDSITDLQNMTLRTASGADIPFLEAADIIKSRAQTTIYRREGRRVLTVTARTDPQSAAEQIQNDMVSTMLPDMQADYPGLTYSFTGQAKDMRESMASLVQNFIFAMLCVYAILAIPFKSYIQPIIIMSCIPFGFIGALTGHILMGYDMSIISMMGIVALSGVVINDSLVLINYANVLHRQEGQSPLLAIGNAAQRRFRPILLTTLTTFGGLMPMIFETSRQARFLIPMALSLGFGVLFSTVIVLLFVPCLYITIEEFRARLGFVEKNENLEGITD